MNKTWQRVKWLPVLLALILSTSSDLWAQVSGKVKVASIYTVPVEQQWVSRIHKALNAAKARGEIEYSFSEHVANTDYERVMREYSEQGNHLLVGEVFGVERAARKVAKDYPSTSYLMGSSFGPSGKNFSVFDLFFLIRGISRRIKNFLTILKGFERGRLGILDSPKNDF